MPDDRLEMLKWPHLKVELEDRQKQWPAGARYEFDPDKLTVTWLFEGDGQAPDRLVWHLRREEISSPKPAEVADLIIKQANKVSKAKD